MGQADFDKNLQNKRSWVCRCQHLSFWLVQELWNLVGILCHYSMDGPFPLYYSAAGFPWIYKRFLIISSLCQDPVESSLLTRACPTAQPHQATGEGAQASSRWRMRKGVFLRPQCKRNNTTPGQKESKTHLLTCGPIDTNGSKVKMQLWCGMRSPKKLIENLAPICHWYRINKANICRQHRNSDAKGLIWVHVYYRVRGKVEIQSIDWFWNLYFHLWFQILEILVWAKSGFCV